MSLTPPERDETLAFDVSVYENGDFMQREHFDSLAEAEMLAENWRSGCPARTARSKTAHTTTPHGRRSRSIGALTVEIDLEPRLGRDQPGRDHLGPVVGIGVLLAAPLSVVEGQQWQEFSSDVVAGVGSSRHD
jgi:hypothetical protein